MKMRGRPRGNHKSGLEQVKNVLRVLFAIQRARFGLTVAEIAEEAGGSVRTAYRIIRVLEEVGVKVERLLPNGLNGPWRFRADPRVVAEMRIRRAL